MSVTGKCVTIAGTLKWNLGTTRDTMTTISIMMTITMTITTTIVTGTVVLNAPHPRNVTNVTKTTIGRTGPTHVKVVGMMIPGTVKSAGLSLILAEVPAIGTGVMNAGRTLNGHAKMNAGNPMDVGSVMTTSIGKTGRTHVNIAGILKTWNVGITAGLILVRKKAGATGTLVTIAGKPNGKKNGEKTGDPRPHVS